MSNKKATIKPEEIVHYGMFVKLTTMKARGTAACCATGVITGYAAFVTCTECQEIAKAFEGDDNGQA
jgi:hypothetical protein